MCKLLQNLEFYVDWKKKTFESQTRFFTLLKSQILQTNVRLRIKQLSQRAFVMTCTELPFLQQRGYVPCR